MTNIDSPQNKLVKPGAPKPQPEDVSTSGGLQLTEQPFSALELFAFDLADGLNDFH